MLKIFIATVGVLLSVASANWTKNPLIKTPEQLRQLRALRQEVRDRGCDLNMCFAIQGDEFISAEEFQAQKNFIDILAAILATDEPANFCAVQYASTTKAISPLTFRRHRFLRKLRKAKQVGGFETNIAAALGYTGFQLRTRDGDAKKLVVLGDGLETIGFRPKKIAEIVRKQGIEICAVAVGGFSTTALLDIVGGEPSRIMEINEFFDLAEIIVGLVNDVCGF